MLRDGRYQWTASVLIVLLLGALLAGWKHYVDSEHQREISQTVDRDLWLDQGEKSQHSAAHFGAYAFKPTTALAAIDRGVLPYTGISVFMEAHNVKDAAYRPVDDASAVQRLGSLTASTTLQLLIPLLIILLAFGTFSGERERGTLRQLLSLGVPRFTLGMGKALGVGGPLLFVLIPVTVMGVLAISFFEGGGTSMWGSSRSLFVMGVYLLYFSIYILASLLVSAWASSSRQALLVLLGFWFITSFVAPRVITDAARALHPTPTSRGMETAIDDDMAALPSWSDRTSAVQARLMEEHGVETVDAIPASVAGYTLLEAERDETAVYRKHFEALKSLYESQERITQQGALISPALAVQLASMGLAGSDYMHHRHFVEAAEAYRYNFVQTLNQDMVDTGASWDYRIGRELWEQIPSFTYELPPVSDVLNHYSMSLVFLGVWNVALFLLTTVAIGRINVG